MDKVSSIKSRQIPNITLAFNLCIPKSKEFISFWKMLLDNRHWEKEQQTIYESIKQPLPENAVGSLEVEFYKSVKESKIKFTSDNFAQIENGKLKLSRDQKTLSFRSGKKTSDNDQCRASDDPN